MNATNVLDNMRVEITGIAKGAKLPTGLELRSLEAWMNTAREVGWCKDMPAPIAVKYLPPRADIKATIKAWFDEVLCVMYWPDVR